jgi:hypothetical protein
LIGILEYLVTDIVSTTLTIVEAKCGTTGSGDTIGTRLIGGRLTYTIDGGITTTDGITTKTIGDGDKDGIITAGITVIILTQFVLTAFEVEQQLFIIAE